MSSYVKLIIAEPTVADGTPIPVSDGAGSLTVDNAVLSVVGGGAQATAQRVALADESLAALESINVTVDFEGDASDLDSGVGTDSHAVVAIAVAASGGHVVITGDAANGLDVDVTRSVLPTGAATEAKQDTGNTSVGGLTEAAPATDTASSGLNGRLQRIAQRITSLIALLPTALGANGGLKTEDVIVATVPVQIIKTVAAIATPEALAADGTFFRTALIGGVKAARTANVGIVYLGIGATNDTQPFAINSGEWLTISAPVGQKYDLNDWALDVLNAGDGVAVIYS